MTRIRVTAITAAEAVGALAAWWIAAELGLAQPYLAAVLVAFASAQVWLVRWQTLRFHKALEDTWSQR